VKPERMWAVAAVRDGATAFVYAASMAFNRGTAIAWFSDLWSDGRAHYDRERRAGRVRCVRVLVTEEVAGDA
jgi:hypothetical protein